MHRLLSTTLCILAVSLLMTGCGGKKYDASLQGENVNYGEVLDGFMKRAETAVMQVQDMPSARKAADTIGLVNQNLDDLVYNAPRLSEQGQIELGRIAAEHLTEVQRLKRDIDRNPVLAEVFEQDLTDMIGQLTKLVSGNYEDETEQ